MAFANVLFPRDISYGSQGGPEFSTSIVTSGSKREQRNRNLYQPVWKWNVIYGVKTLADYQALYTFFLARAGKWQAFLFEDPVEHDLFLEEIAIGDGVETTFQGTRTHTSGDDSLVRTLTKFSEDTKIFVNNVEQTSGVTFDPLTGIWVFTTPPALNAVIAITGTFYFAARFDVDYLPAIADSRGADLILRIESIPIVEAPGE